MERHIKTITSKMGTQQMTDNNHSYTYSFWPESGESDTWVSHQIAISSVFALIFYLLSILYTLRETFISCLTNQYPQPPTCGIPKRTVYSCRKSRLEGAQNRKVSKFNYLMMLETNNQNINYCQFTALKTTNLTTETISMVAHGKLTNCKTKIQQLNTRNDYFYVKALETPYQFFNIQIIFACVQILLNFTIRHLSVGHSL